MTSWNLIEDGLLVAIYQGANTLSDLERLFPGLSREALEDILKNLEARGLVKREVKGLLFKKTIYKLTPSGISALEEARRRLEEAAEKAKQSIDPQTGTLRQPYNSEASDLITLLPLLVFLGLLPQIYLAPLIAAQAVEESYEEADTGEEAGGEEGFDIVDIEPL